MFQPLSEYPRPQLQRSSYLCLNGEWEYAIRKFKRVPDEFDGKIIVPFSPEMEASGVQKTVMPDEFLFYKYEFDIPKEYRKQKILLHFGAVDQIADVIINGSAVGKHVGGFLPFEFDIHSYIKEHNELIVRVKDVSDSSHFSRGKQRLNRGGIWYTPQSGIYMPVWLEAVDRYYVKKLRITPNIDKKCVQITVYSDSKNVEIHLLHHVYKVRGNEEITIPIDDPILWSPENPHLYYFVVKTEDDEVKSYFAMRKFSTIVDARGFRRLALNNKPYFMKGVLDQGYYRLGGLTPSSDADYISDINTMKELGFNTLRKHIKIESLRWYYHCDRLGMIVWQDFVNGGSKYKFPIISFPLFTNIHLKDNQYKLFGRENEEGRKLALQEYNETMDLLYNSPCIGLWTIFNEGWGQFDAKKIYDWAKIKDPTRLYDHASGWHDQGCSDTKSLHVYFKRVHMPTKAATKDRAIILSEAGGYTLPYKENVFSDKKFGYKMLKTSEQLVNEYSKFIHKDIIKNIPKGLSAFIYTQLSDVEDELNGFITYDRKRIKVNKKDIAALNKLLDRFKVI